MSFKSHSYFFELPEGLLGPATLLQRWLLRGSVVLLADMKYSKAGGAAKSAWSEMNVRLAEVSVGFVRQMPDNRFSRAYQRFQALDSRSASTLNPATMNTNESS